MFHGLQNRVVEVPFASSKSYADPFNEVTLDVEITSPAGEARTVPAFWAGGHVWRMRYTSSEVGTHGFRSVCSDASNGGLHDRRGEIEVAPDDGEHPLYSHGPLRVSDNGRTFEHADGQPFFWLGDTWWMGLCRRLRFPDEFAELMHDRVRKGFTVIQLVAGLYPDMPGFDPRSANEAGFAWTEDYGAIRPEYFDMADLRIARLVDAGLVPCILGCWGYYLPWMGVEKMKQHWRYLVARYGAYPVVWCLAGEGAMPWYLSKDRQGDAETQRQGWTELAHYLHAIDSFHHPVTIHPTDSARNQVIDAATLDFDMLQTGHGDRGSFENTMRLLTRSREAEPAMPTVIGEVCYEGIGEACRQEVQRFLFWTCMLNGAGGFTYGANGIWQLNRRDEPYGPSPHGMAWGDTPWDDAYRLPGSEHIGLAKRLLERYPWWDFEPHPEWIDPHWSEGDVVKPHAAGIPGKVRIVFIPSPGHLPVICGIESDVRYRAFFWFPWSGEQRELGEVVPGPDGHWRVPLARQPYFADSVLVLETPGC